MDSRPAPLPLNAQNLVILNRITCGLGEGAVKDLLFCYGNVCRPAPLPLSPLALSLLVFNTFYWSPCKEDGGIDCWTIT